MTSETIAKMRERGILYQGSMVKALLAGTKTNTRRIVKPQPDTTHGGEPYWSIGGLRTSWIKRPAGAEPHWGNNPLLSPYGETGDRLWVRETFFAWGRWETRYSAKKKRDEWHFIDMTLECGESYLYAADGVSDTQAFIKRRGGVEPMYWKRPAIFMPRAASRILLEITDTTAERLNSISCMDAWAEGIGVPGQHYDIAEGVQMYRVLWEEINGAGSWDANPLVWSVKFKVVQP